MSTPSRHLCFFSRSDQMRSETDLIGRTVEEAIDEVDQFLERAFLAGMPA
jgi:dsDNA-specific endonuclease/ATPase MutS2